MRIDGLCRQIQGRHIYRRHSDEFADLVDKTLWLAAHILKEHDQNAIFSELVVPSAEMGRVVVPGGYRRRGVKSPLETVARQAVVERELVGRVGTVDGISQSADYLALWNVQRDSVNCDRCGKVGTNFSDRAIPSAMAKPRGVPLDTIGVMPIKKVRFLLWERKAYALLKHPVKPRRTGMGRPDADELG